MGLPENKVAFVVATKDREEELCQLLGCLEAQTYPVGQVVIVDGGKVSLEREMKLFQRLNLKYLRCHPPSAARQRNLGLEVVCSSTSLLGFLDDDVILENDALEEMMKFWEDAPADIGGAAFNQVNPPPVFASGIKSSFLTEKLGLYSKRKGKVLVSGFHTMIGHVQETFFVDWLPTTATLWRREIFDTHRFDEWFSGYSYLEDLDFSYRVGKTYRLAVVREACYRHYPAPAGREGDYVFGKREVANRIHFVRKYPEFSLMKCYLGIFLRMLISLSLTVTERRSTYLERLRGNVTGLFQSIKHGNSGMRA